MTVRGVAWAGVKLAVAVPLVIAGAVRDEIRWRRLRSRVPLEPGMREWFAATCEDVARVRRSMRG